MSDTTALTVLKLLAKGRGVQFVASVADLTAKDVLELAEVHGAARPDGSVDEALLPAAVARLEAAASPRLRTRELPPPAPALAPVTTMAGTTADGTLLLVAIGRVHPDPDNPRDSVGDISGLIASLREIGMLQPIIARRTTSGRFVIVAGHRRYAAARAAGWDKVPVIVRADMRPDAVLAAMLAENGHRADLDPIEEARGLARLKGQLGCTEAELGRRIGRHQTHVSARLRLLSLSAEDQQALRAGEMKLVEATAKARLNAGRVRPKRPDTAYFSAGHELAPLAKARCRRLHTRVVTMPGGIACGDCWSSVIRADERQHLHERSGASGACALCSAPIAMPTTRGATG